VYVGSQSGRVPDHDKPKIVIRHKTLHKGRPTQWSNRRTAPGGTTPIGLLRRLAATRWYSLRMKTRSMLTLEDCKKISAAAEAEAKKNNWNVCITIHDDGGHLLHLVRMDGATPANSRIAIEKGRTAAETRRSTAMWEERIKGGRLSMLKMPGVTPVQGGLPIVIDGACVGAVGVSGVQSHEDEQLAKAGIDALGG
jgi:glc operon protein GlcG